MRFIALIFAVIIGFGLKAQPLSSVPYEMNIETAEEQLALNDFYNARTYFINAYEQERSSDLALRIAQLNEMLRDYKKAASWYNRVMKRDKQDAYLSSRYDYANVLKQMGKYGEAVDQYNYFIDRTKNDLLIEKAKLQIQGIKDAASMVEDIAITVKNAGRKLNGKFEEASPSLDPDGSMLYSTINTDEVIVLDGKNENVYSQIFSAEFDEKKKVWKKGTALDKEINREGFHTANASISLDGSRMYFTRSTLGGNKVVESKAYVSFKAASGWGPAQELTGVNGDYIVKHPVAGELYGNEVLFFASDMDGGKGGFDIYYCTRKGDVSYSLPTNLGSTINSSGDDVTPYYNNGILYFSSDGHPSIGGFDVFSSSWDGASWSKAENMGVSYNSTYDDLYFSLNKEGNSGFMISNRPGTTTKSLGGKTCCADIWKVEKRALVIDLFARGVDEEGNTVEDVTGEMYDLTERGSPVIKRSNPETNKVQFLLDADKAYKFVIKKDGYFPAEKEINTVGKIENYTYKKKFLLKKKPVDPKIEIVTINEPIRLGNIYYDFNDDKILPDAEGDLSVLKGLMDTYPDMVIELGSHTDSRGGDDYNQQLSERRAESAKRWLVQKGVDEDRIDAVGYGEEAILNECENGVRCSDKDHRFNRRTEFKITAGPTTIEIKKEVFK